MENEESAIDKFKGVMETAITGIPAPVRKNFFKAFSQLCTAAIDIPVAWLEGKSAELKAASNARVKIINQEAELFSENIAVPKEYVQKASEKFASKILREQVILDDITLRAAKELTNKDENCADGAGKKDHSQKEIDTEWLNEFENLARSKSSEDMKIIFSRILSSEIKEPGAFSIRTIKIISELDSETAKLFQKLCSMVSAMHRDGNLFEARVISMTGRPSINALSKYGLSFPNLNVLEEYGLIISDYDSWVPFKHCIVDENNERAATFKFGNTHYVIKPIDRAKYDKELKVGGVKLTNTGKELYKITPPIPAIMYKADLDDYFYKKGFEVVTVA